MNYPSYNPASDNRPLSDDELNELDHLLAHLPSDGALNIEALDGYLTALVLSPIPLPQVPGADWLPVVWGGDAPTDANPNAPFASGKQRKRVVMDVLRHVHSVAYTVQIKPQQWEPIFSVADGDDEELVDAEDWCVGFMSAVDLAPDAWAQAFQQPAQAEALARIAQLAGGTDEAVTDDPAARNLLARALLDAVLTLRA
jgi:uncharacterized protein